MVLLLRMSNLIIQDGYIIEIAVENVNENCIVALVFNREIKQ